MLYVYYRCIERNYTAFLQEKADIEKENTSRQYTVPFPSGNIDSERQVYVKWWPIVFFLSFTFFFVIYGTSLASCPVMTLSSSPTCSILFCFMEGNADRETDKQVGTFR